MMSKNYIRAAYNNNSDYWQKIKRQKTLAIFHATARRVPAYRDFLNKNKIRPEKVRTWSDFKLVPLVNKDNYLRKYSLPELSWDGNLKKPLVFTVTSGSSGTPYYFTRGQELDEQAAILHEIFLRATLGKNVGPTLVIDAFGMGVWIGGLITYKAFEIFSRERKFPLSIITPGINKNEVFNALRKLSPYYDQTIICGYPPFVKDVLEEATSQGVNLKKLNLRFSFAAETFSEGFRDYLADKAGVKNIYRDFYNIYGSADIGAMAAETPSAILIKRLAGKDRHIFRALFSQNEKSPTLAQYFPHFINFESIGDELALTGDNAIPLVRYALGDRGGVFSFDEAVEKLSQFGINMAVEARRAKISDCLLQLPFVYVYERIDFSASLCGIIIYPEYIREALLDVKLAKWLTGRFSMGTKYDQQQDQYLEINLELKKNVRKSRVLKSVVLTKLVSNMLSRSSEFRELVKHLGKRAYPRLIFWPVEDQTYFKLGVKQKWILK